jgi:hypothetical protein
MRCQNQADKIVGRDLDLLDSRGWSLNYLKSKVK